ncbi:MAG TPA: tetratricopeptide repeat protein, partial [Tepidisphaeraceae bacterium]|nr:tetratricopeptide repeat protein [Tepidisphaeraceae bacterium]
MKRRTNAQWIVYALAAFLIGGICLYAGAKYVLKRHVQSWKRDGIAASIAGDNEKAVELLGQFLRYQPGDMDALVYYVKSRELVPMAHSQHLAETVRALRRILDEDPSRVDDRRHLLELYCKLDRGPEALDTANEILRKIPNDARTLQLKAEMLMRMSRDQEAMDTVAKWITAAPTDIQPRMMQIALDTKAGQSSDAIIAGADDLRRRHPGDPRFELLEGFAYEAAGNQALAVQWLQSAAGHPQLPPDVVQPLIQQLDNVGMSRQSLALLQRMLQQSGDSSIREQLAHRLWETERWSEVVSTLSGLDPSDRSADATLLAMKAMALARLKATGAKVADPAPYVAALSARDEPVAHAWSKMLSRQGNEPAGNDRDLAAALTAAVSEDPGNPYLLFFLGETYLRLGEADLAESAFRRSSDVDISWSMPAVRLVDTMLQKGQPSEAFDVATMSLRRNPNNAATVIALASAWSAGVEAGTVGNVDRLLQLVGDAQAQMPNDQRIGLIKAQLLAEEGQVDQARAAVRSLMAHKPPPDESVYISLATLSWKTGMGIEQECFDQCRRVHGISPDLAYAETVDRFEVNHDDELPFFDSLAKQAGATSDMKWRLARVKYLDLTNAPSAPAEWKSLGEAYPNNLGVQEAMMSAQTLQGNWDIMEPTIERVRALTGDDALEWRLAGAKLLVTAPRTQDDVEKGALRLDDLIQKYPQLPEAHVFLAKALVQMKRVDGAIEQLSIASKLAPTSVPIALELASLLQSQGDFDRVQQELDRVTPQLQTESQRQQAAMILSKQNDAAGAATILERPAPVSASPADRDQSDLFLAMLYRQQHQYDRAEQISARLMQHPSPQIVQFVASLYTSEGKIDQA